MKVLVYGTLKEGRGNDSYLGNCELIEKGEYKIDNCVLKEDGLPYLFKSETNISTPFVGEMYLINDGILGGLDRLEGHPTFYTREFIKHLDCYVYVCYNKDLNLAQNIYEF